MPDVTFFNNDITPRDFDRADPISAGHQRRSPGDRQAAKEAAALGPSDLGPGILPTPAVTETYGPIRASDFVRGDIGTANSSGLTPRTPLGPDDPLFSGGRNRGDNLQADGQPSPMEGNPFPDSAGRTGSGDGARHQVVKPQIDTSPSLGAEVAATITKEGHVVYREEPKP
jgi:hypothetical protein